MTGVATSFVPWRDDALLPSESAYALLNKVSWFAGLGPAALLRACRHQKHAAVSPREVDFRTSLWTRYLEDTSKLPEILGMSALQAIEASDQAMRREVPLYWMSPYLRMCKRCISAGIHLRIHQHLAVARCPLHGCSLEVTCRACGSLLPFASGSNAAFTCPCCNQSLLSSVGLRYRFPEKFKKKVAAVCRDVGKWLVLLNAGLHRRWEGHCVEVRAGHALGRIDDRSLLLAGIRNSSRRAPAWMENPSNVFAGISIARIVPVSRSLATSMQIGRNVTQWVVKQGDPKARESQRCRDFWSPLVESEPEERYLQAFRRVAARFIRSIQHRHGECLDSATLISNVTGSHREEISAAMLLCCPVALGYWLWRRRGSEFFPSISSFRELYDEDGDYASVGVGTDLLLYALERSDLHASILVASECSKHWDETGDLDGAMDILASWEKMRRSYQCTESSWLDFKLDDGGFTFLRVDASIIMQAEECPGLEPYYEVLRHHLRSAPIFNRRTGKIERWDMESAWSERAATHLRQLDPRQEFRAWGGRRCHAPSFFAMRNPNGRDDACACVSSAMTARVRVAPQWREPPRLM